MSDDNGTKSSAPASRVEKMGTVATEIAYCPHLDIYHYRKADGVEYMFDTLGLEKALEGYLKQANGKQVEFMALLTGFARQFPHQVVSFDEQGRLNLRELLVREISGDPEEDAGKEGKVLDSGTGQPFGIRSPIGTLSPAKDDLLGGVARELSPVKKDGDGGKSE